MLGYTFNEFDKKYVGLFSNNLLSDMHVNFFYILATFIRTSFSTTVICWMCVMLFILYMLCYLFYICHAPLYSDVGLYYHRWFYAGELIVILQT